MKFRPIFLALAGAAALTLTACKTIEQAPAPTSTIVPSPAVTPGSAPTLAPTPSPTLPSPPTPKPSGVEPLACAPDVPPGDYAPWQRAYMDYLTRRCREEVPLIRWARTASSEEVEADLEKWNAANAASNHYVLCDVDKDGVPELFIALGQLSSPIYECYTYRDGEVTSLGELYETCAGFYAWPGENALLVGWGRMSHWGYSKYCIEDGVLADQGVMYEWEMVNGEIVGEKEAEEIVPGAVFVPYFYTRSLHDVDEQGAVAPLLLPICDYEAPPRQEPAPLEEAEVRAAVGKVLWENGSFIGISGDNFYGHTGPITWEEYIGPRMAYPYNDEPLIPKEYAFADVNGDGQTDGVLRLEEQPDEYGNLDQFYVVFNVQDETVYGYFFAWKDGMGVDPDGSVYFGEFDSWRQASFYKNQCYDFPASREPVEGADLAWDEYPANP